jgi:hypothetical protein
MLLTRKDFSGPLKFGLSRFHCTCLFQLSEAQEEADIVRAWIYLELDDKDNLQVFNYCTVTVNDQ